MAPGADLRERIRAEALRQGFVACGFAAAVAPAPGAAHLGSWLAAGHDADMRWIARTADKRHDPQRVVRTARTVVSLLAFYGDAADRPPHPGTGVIARYARGRDYHRVLERRLRELTRWLADATATDAADHAHRWYVDTGPVLEKPWAQAAGLGWVGKHTNLVSRTFGNWTFCAEILTSVTLPPDPSHDGFCGTCDACVGSCPTAAIVAPYQLDARRCISYLTIELRGMIPPEFRTAIGDRVYGCDDCLAVCPWNRFAATAAAAGRVDPELAPRPGQSFPDLVALLELSESEYAARFHGTALTRAKRSGLRRNAAVALGNVGGPAAVPPLTRALGDDDPIVRAHAAWALGRIATPDAHAALSARNASEPDPAVRAEITAALGS